MPLQDEEEQKNTLLKSLKDILLSPDFVAFYQNQLAKPAKRPEGWSESSNSPYFRDYVGQEIKVVVDEIIADKQPRVWRYADWPELKPNTIYLRVQQGLRYLLEKLDPDGKYKIERQRMEQTKVKSGVRLGYIPQPLKPFKPVILVEEDDVSPWRAKIDKYLTEGEPGSKCIIKGLSLDDEQIASLEEMLGGLEGIVYLVTGTEILLRKQDI